MGLELELEQEEEEEETKISSPLAYAEVAPRRGKAASARPHQGVPFNAKPTPSPAKSSGM